MKHEPLRVPPDVHGAVSGFLVLLVKGLLDDDRWDWDVDGLNRQEWKAFQEAILDPTHLRTTLAVYMNNLRLSADGRVLNYSDARFRAFQYFRAYLGLAGYTLASLSPPLEPWELEEPDWRTWEA
ncbi:hypothetical protein AB1L30_10100 [Bremerella sp. JC817]|uniref:DUF7677 family protein n=1 Tax=Bremerella sp. JC817 TaxID=3231756 RepID=UPI00345A6C8A